MWYLFIRKTDGTFAWMDDGGYWAPYPTAMQLERIFEIIKDYSLIISKIDRFEILPED